MQKLYIKTSKCKLINRLHKNNGLDICDIGIFHTVYY